MQTANVFLSLSVAMFLSACGTDISSQQSATPAVPNGTQKEVIAEVVLQDATTTRATDAKLKTPQLKIDDDPQNLLGLNPRKLADQLGSPGFVRRDGSAEVWQYLAEACILDIFLYRNKGVFAVDYVELRARGASQLSRRDCYREMLRVHLNAKQG